MGATFGLRVGVSGLHVGFIWAPAGIHVGATWDTSGVAHMETIWWVAGIHVGFMWHPAGIHVGATWYLCGVGTWDPPGGYLGFEWDSYA